KPPAGGIAERMFHVKHLALSEHFRLNSRADLGGWFWRGSSPLQIRRAASGRPPPPSISPLRSLRPSSRHFSLIATHKQTPRLDWDLPRTLRDTRSITPWSWTNRWRKSSSRRR